MFLKILSANGIDHKNINNKKHFLELPTKTEVYYN